MNRLEDDFVDDQIRNSVSIDPPAAVDRCLSGQLAAFRFQFDAASAQRPGVLRAFPWTRREWVLGGMAAGLAVVIPTAIVLWPRDSFAEVAAAVLGQSWVHLRAMEGNRIVYEQWYSPTKQILASRFAGSIEFEDYRLGVYDSYDSNEQVLYRGPIVWRSRGSDLDSLASALAVLLQHERPVDKPLAHLDFLGPGRAKMKVLDQRVERVSERDRIWLDYRLTVKSPESAEPIRMLFRVDAVTKLPRLWRIESRQGEKVTTVERLVDYPQAGPADIYDVGVPKTARLVDRLPSDDVKRILATIRAGRVRMDDYRAVFVMHLDIDHAWWTDLPSVFYRKGLQFRADQPLWTGNRAVKRPDEGTDQAKWWFDRIKFFRFYPVSILRDSTLYQSSTKNITDPDGSLHVEIASVQPVNFGNNPEEMYPPEYSTRPEFACRPPLGIGHQHMEPTLDLRPAEGPPGCILLSVQHTSTKDRVNEKGIGIPDGFRYWLDPKRDYIVMRWDWIIRDAKDRAVISESDITEETARSPKGVWYATRIRRTFPARDGKSKSPDQIYKIYVDFNVNLETSLFEPPKIGRVY
jgi:hypothetical protein